MNDTKWKFSGCFTPDHQVLKQGGEWVAAKDLQVGDVLEASGPILQIIPSRAGGLIKVHT